MLSHMYCMFFPPVGFWLAFLFICSKSRGTQGYKPGRSLGEGPGNLTIYIYIYNTDYGKNFMKSLSPQNVQRSSNISSAHGIL